MNTKSTITDPRGVEELIEDARAAGAGRACPEANARPKSERSAERVSTGIAGLDTILGGGLLPRKAYLLRGGPGLGKTTIGFHFLRAGASEGKKSLFITLGETEAQLRENAGRLGFELGNVEFLDLSPSSEFFANIESYDIFSPAEVEREPVTQRIMQAVTDLAPSRIFIDSMTQFRYLAPDAFQFRKQVLSFIRFLTEKGATVLFTSEAGTDAPDDDLMFLSDGIISLSMAGGARQLEVLKFRGSDYHPGAHAYAVRGDGVRVYPKLVPSCFSAEVRYDTVSSGVPEIDQLLHGGLERGTITVISGPSGTGKTTMGMQFMKEAAGRGERSVVYAFEESEDKILARCESVNIPARAMVASGRLKIVRVEPLALLPDQFADMVRAEVEGNGARVVMIDSTSGCEIAMGGQDPRAHLHAVCKYMSNMGVMVLLPTEVRDVTGEFKISDHHISYLADNIIFLRYLEIGGEIRRAIGVLKKRLGSFEKTLREFEITCYGIKVGEPLCNLRNVLSGTPVFAKERED